MVFTSPFSRPQGADQQPPAHHGPPQPRGPITLSFNIPFSSNLDGPELDEILHASPGALERWQHVEGIPSDAPVHRLPVHVQNVENLRNLCNEVAENEQPAVEASVTVSEPKPVTNLRRPIKGQVTNVCLTGEAETVQRLRGRILQSSPVALVCLDSPFFNAHFHANSSFLPEMCYR
jgi:hypothetical protein